MIKKFKEITLFIPIILFGLGMLVFTLREIYHNKENPELIDVFFIRNYDFIGLLCKVLWTASIINLIANCVMYLFRKKWKKLTFSIFSIVICIIIYVICMFVMILSGPRMMGVF
jgi:uncharacterized BrkB/YihY/UPF0761 family membrane protein